MNSRQLLEASRVTCSVVPDFLGLSTVDSAHVFFLHKSNATGLRLAPWSHAACGTTPIIARVSVSVGRTTRSLFLRGCEVSPNGSRDRGPLGLMTEGGI